MRSLLLLSMVLALAARTTAQAVKVKALPILGAQMHSLSVCVPEKDKCQHSRDLGHSFGKTTAEIFAVQGRSVEEGKWYLHSMLRTSDVRFIDHKCFTDSFSHSFKEFYKKFRDDAKRCAAPPVNKPDDCPCCGATIRKYKTTIEQLEKELRMLEQEEKKTIRKYEKRRGTVKPEQAKKPLGLNVNVKVATPLPKVAPKVNAKIGVGKSKVKLGLGLGV